MLNFDLVRYYLDNGDTARFRTLFTPENVNSSDLLGWTALHYASNRKYNIMEDGQFIRILVEEFFADMNVKNEMHETPLHIATFMFSGVLTETLLKLRASVHNITKTLQTTPLQYLFRLYNCDGSINKLPQEDIRKCTWLFLERGVKVNSVRSYCSSQWLIDMENGRNAARQAAGVLIGIRRYRHSKVLEINGMDAVRLVGQFIWKARREWVNKAMFYATSVELSRTISEEGNEVRTQICCQRCNCCTTHLQSKCEH